MQNDKKNISQTDNKEETLIDRYKRLNEKCDEVLSKIKKRKLIKQVA